MKASPLSDKFDQLKKGGIAAVVSADGIVRDLHIAAVRPLTGGCGITFEEIRTPEEARQLRGSMIAVARDTLPLQEGEYWQDDIIGLSVVTTEGVHLGTIVDIFSAGAGDVYVVESGGREYLIPAIRDVIVEISLEDGQVIIRVMEGLLD